MYGLGFFKDKCQGCIYIYIHILERRCGVWGPSTHTWVLRFWVLVGKVDVLGQYTIRHRSEYLAQQPAVQSGGHHLHLATPQTLNASAILRLYGRNGGASCPPATVFTPTNIWWFPHPPRQPGHSAPAYT